MPSIDPHGPFVLKSRKGGETKYLPGAGRLNWGEGLDHKPDPRAVRQIKKKSHRVTLKGEHHAGKGAEEDEDSD